jgi:transcriptional regulator with XRE-family HTH domain
MDRDERFGDVRPHVIKRRLRHYLTKREIADKSGVHPSTVSKFFRDPSTASLATLFQLWRLGMGLDPVPWTRGEERLLAMRLLGADGDA